MGGALVTIDPDVRGKATYWGLDPRLIQAVVNAEGGGTAIIRAVQCSIPSVQTREKAIEVLCRSCAHALCDYVKAHHAESFVAFWGARWAPRGVANDPTDLNAHWAPNVTKLWDLDL